jgi:hypothetical protein
MGGAAERDAHRAEAEGRLIRAGDPTHRTRTDRCRGDSQAVDPHITV